jgi:hypothetical protein
MHNSDKKVNNNNNNNVDEIDGTHDIAQPDEEWPLCILYILYIYIFYIYGCMFCMLLFNVINYLFLLLCFMYCYCYVCSVLCILFHCVVLCTVFVQMCTVLLPPGVNPITLNAIYLYHIISYHINTSVSLSTVLTVEMRVAEGRSGRLKSTLNKIKSLKFRFGTGRPAVSKRVGQDFNLLKTFFKNKKE